MGLLDGMGDWLGQNSPGLLGSGQGVDPMQANAMRQGLMTLGLNLLRSRGSFGQALGESGLQGLQAYEGSLQGQRQQQMQDWQFQQQKQAAERQRAMQQLPQQFVTPAMKPESMDNRDVGQPGEAPVAPSSFDFGGYAKALAQYDPTASLQMQASLRKDTTPIKLGANEALVDPTTYKPLFTNPKEQAPTDVGKLLTEFNALPQNDPRRPIYLDAIKKATTHQPAVTVANYGSPVPVQLPDGSTALVQPSNRAGQPPQIMTLPGSNGVPLRPAKDLNASLTEDQGKATGWLVQAENAWKNMQSAMGAKTSNGKTSYSRLDVARPGFPDMVAGIPSFGLSEAIGNAMRGADRQKFMQASSSLSEAMLRAATGAGVNKDEAAQKIKELTPVFGENPATTKQKMDSIPIYLESLRVRAGPGAKQVPAIMNRNQTPAAPGGSGGWGIQPAGQ